MPNKKLIASIIAIAIIVVAVIGAVWFTPRTSINELNQELSVSVIDDFGREIALSRIPTRIVSLAPSITEIIFALGLEDRLVGVTSYCDYPPEVNTLKEEGKIDVVGGLVDPNLEKIVSLKPDLVLASGITGVQGIESLEQRELTVVVLNPANVSGILSDIRLVGKITNSIDTAEKLAQAMEERVEYVMDKAARVSYRPRVYFEIWSDPLMGIGPKTFIDDMIKMAGGVNIFSDATTEWPVVSSETIVARNPEIIIIQSKHMGGVSTEDVMNRPGWEVIDAVKSKRIYEVDADPFFRSGPRIVDGLETLARIIHPELFESVVQ